MQQILKNASKTCEDYFVSPPGLKIELTLRFLYNLHILKTKIDTKIKLKVE